MASLTEHAALIKAAIKAAQEDGFKVEVDLTYEPFGSQVEMIEVDLWGEGGNYVTVFTEDRNG